MSFGVANQNSFRTRGSRDSGFNKMGLSLIHSFSQARLWRSVVCSSKVEVVARDDDSRAVLFLSKAVYSVCRGSYRVVTRFAFYRRIVHLRR